MANEKRLIDANALLAGICKDCGNGCDLENSYCILATEIMKAPTVDAVEVVHAEWSIIEDDYCGLTALQCSECNQEYWFEDEPPMKIYNYCPNCGAKMDGGENNE